MNWSRIGSVTAGIAMVVMLAACGGGGDAATAEDGGTQGTEEAAPTTGLSLRSSTTSSSTTTTTAKAKEMPDLIGMTEAQATSALSKMGISDVRIQKQENLQKAGTVLEQVPSSGSDAAAGVTVNLIVATQLPPMPDYKNRLVGDVRSWFVDRGIEIRTTPVLRDDLADGTILSTTPGPNEPISGEVLMQVSEKPVTKQLNVETPVERKCDMSVNIIDASVNGATLQNSIDMSYNGDYDHSCALDYDLGRDWDTFKATVGLGDQSAAGQSVRFEVFVDGKPTFNQTVGFGQTAEVSVDVKNALRIQLRVTELGGGKVHGVFGNARVIGSASATAQTSTTSTSR